MEQILELANNEYRKNKSEGRPCGTSKKSSTGEVDLPVDTEKSKK